ncbi:phosphoenolpyruvate--protein phosphotransferase [Microbacterium sp. JB110]|uniref:phosphoenolpyruvate--protein phosphotransferase n=1 Tax=Microbacterium sp. JB110 TaxID=2024477 RepID=UPI00097EF50F|nr:phosphoenolpyruvate--protein phosphotransferase [Microbacterium sp. JB110]RCS61518.1 phosphoenolpyruvate--protein phosphotransferase [Microbacterium sp. JB110]SJM65354.1 Phosphoenolpyruvate-protein phosphotransferase of PTS system [Frigoribacterium sp. JB110]
MTEIAGVGIGHGIAHGPVALMAAPLEPPTDAPSTRTPDEEKALVASAVSATAADLNERGERAGGSARDVLEAQAMMAEDPTLAEAVEAKIDGGATGEYAVHTSFAEFAEQLAEIGGYLGERAADLADVAQRVIAQLRGAAAPGVPDLGHPFVLVARDLAPADTALLDLDQVLAVVTTDGGPTSHTAILAREKGIVAVVGTGDASLTEGQTVIVDAAGDVVVADPTPDEIAAADQRAAARAAAVSAPITPGALADGTEVPLLANLGSPDGATEALELGAEGVGLFRTEFLFLSSDEAPSVADQTASYRLLLEAFAGKKVVVRVLDAGADKPLPFLTDADEENPALGRRGIRALQHREHVLRDQLTALAEADSDTDADLWVMAPMVATVDEAEYFTALARELGLRTTGVMVEVPSSAILAEEILRKADFASIGTNDLTQYTMAADRLLGTVAHLQSPWHPAVLRLIRMVADGGEKNGKPVGICGEAAADPLLAVVLVGLGVTSLSMTPAALAEVRAELKRHTIDDARRIAAAAVSAGDAAGAKKAARDAA